MSPAVVSRVAQPGDWRWAIHPPAPANRQSRGCAPGLMWGRGGWVVGCEERAPGFGPGAGGWMPSVSPSYVEPFVTSLAGGWVRAQSVLPYTGQPWVPECAGRDQRERRVFRSQRSAIPAKCEAPRKARGLAVGRGGWVDALPPVPGLRPAEPREMLAPHHGSIDRSRKPAPLTGQTVFLIRSVSFCTASKTSPSSVMSLLILLTA